MNKGGKAVGAEPDFRVLRWWSRPLSGQGKSVCGWAVFLASPLAAPLPVLGTILDAMEGMLDPGPGLERLETLSQLLGPAFGQCLDFAPPERPRHPIRGYCATLSARFSIRGVARGGGRGLPFPARNACAWPSPEIRAAVPTTWRPRWEPPAARTRCATAPAGIQTAIRDLFPAVCLCYGHDTFRGESL